jgi:hypothetical protein
MGPWLIDNSGSDQINAVTGADDRIDQITALKTAVRDQPYVAIDLGSLVSSPPDDLLSSLLDKHLHALVDA